MGNKQNNENLDRLLEEYLKDSGLQNKTLNEFGKTVLESVNTAANSHGYDSISEMINDEIAMGLNVKEKPKKPSLDSLNNRECHTRYDYFMETLNGVEYDSRYRGHYKSGHLEALDKYIDRVELNRDNLTIVDKMLHQELSVLRKERNQSLYLQGYIDGLKMVDKALRKSKNEMMKQVYQTVMAALQ
ncbi:MAG: hypothetical protein PUF50_01325 [Erysipelotrichaceae bacterium]|nr:hypothetical protein [Erysipelotrichaceae bacterium]